MGYVIMLFLLIGWVFSRGTSDVALVAAGLFAIAGAISFHE
ncbi:hypothetical protein [Blautia hansenii]|uniref:Uncharacterized protein n=1 Tax=Blautia hansenii DSM 20583 TaxID=537007 RepID=C9L7U8_BLAHA|nr:hypothetical protein [Blautia hansenii]EEX21843.1 hypothetical protein BLAHAN_05468 [Blautia hansenii DSM 20583]UWO09498.1 hypothetical protein NQ538_09415 [Blautia hansenii DSM 20583]